MTLKATTTVKVYRHPGADDEDHGAVREGDFPIQDDRSRYIRPLEVNGSEEEPDIFDVRDRLPFEFAGDSPQQAGQRASRIEADLAAHYDGLEVIDNDDGANTDGGEY